MTDVQSPFGSRRPRLLDLFCGAGGASRGYHDAGFEVVGVDIRPQPHYPYEFIWDDALFILRRVIERRVIGGGYQRFDAIHASPPCQAYSDLAKRHPDREYPDLIGPVRDLLEQTGLPYVIENVEGAPLRNPALICGTALGLGVSVDLGLGGPTKWYRLRRHRLFEVNWDARGWDVVGTGCICAGVLSPVIDVSGGGPSRAPRRDRAGGRTYKGTADEARIAMGIDWMTKKELNEAIPPAYTCLIGADLLEHLESQRALTEDAA